MRSSRCSLVALALCVQTLTLGAQSVPVRPLGAIVATSARPFGEVTQVIALDDGRVMINDVARRQVVLMDRTLANATVLFDSVAGRENSYGPTVGTLARFTGDSVLFYQSSTKAFAVIGTTAKISRVIASPFAAGAADGGSIGAPTFSPALGFIAALRPGPRSICPATGPPPPAGAPNVILRCEDSTIVLGAPMATRQIDTLVRVSSGAVNTRTVYPAPRSSDAAQDVGLFPFIDAFAVMRDGSLAVLRSREYRMDWINADRTRSSSARLPFDWRAISDAERTRLLDSINTLRTKSYEAKLAKWVSDSTAAGGKGFTGGTISVVNPDGSTLRMVAPRRPQPPTPVDAREIPDFYPPTAAGALLADADNNVWIRSLAGSGEQVRFDIVNRRGMLVDRVRVPASQTIVGFAPGVVFLLAHDGGASTLQAVRIR